MSIAFLVLTNLALAVAVLQLATALRMRGFHRPIDSDVPAERPPVSVLVPLEGAAPGLAERLQGLVRATRTHDQLLLAMETADDDAHPIAEALRRAHPGRDVAIVLAGPAGDRMGKGHNLAAALPHVRHALMAFMDDDVEIEGAVLDEGVRLAGVPGAGAAFGVPYYAGRGPWGGDLVAAYTNYAFAPNMAVLALRGAPRFILGAFWVTTGAALDAAGGLEPHTRTVSDDAAIGAATGAAIGRALHAAGRRNRTLRRPVRLVHAPLSAADGARHLLGWLTLLRAEGAGVYATIALAWNPLGLAIAAGLVGWAAPPVPPPLAAAVVALVVVARGAVVLALNRSVYRSLAPTRFLGTLLAYEACIAPWLFLMGAFRRHVVWRGRRYRLGPRGTIVDA
jgi:hypothetical protein